MHLYFITAASCTTNCLAPVVKVIHESLGTDRGVVTTIHDVTNTQVGVNAPHKDRHRAPCAPKSHSYDDRFSYSHNHDLPRTLTMLSLLPSGWPQWAAIGYVMTSQALSGIAKDLTKMSSKSAIKLVVPPDAEGALFKWAAILTGSKNPLKGIGFFLGGALLSAAGFAGGLWIIVAGLALVLLLSLVFLRRDMGKRKKKVPFSQLFSKTPAVNTLSAARFFLFGARDVWFVVGLPLYLGAVLGWSFTLIGTFFALWIIGYGIVQGAAPNFLKRRGVASADGATSQNWIPSLAILTGLIALFVSVGWQVSWVLVVGLGIFGIVFAINSSVDSYLILAYTDSDKVALNVGFYYMANAGGRLIGTAASGLLYTWLGLAGCLWGAVFFLLCALLISFQLPRAEHDPLSIPSAA